MGREGMGLVAMAEKGVSRRIARGTLVLSKRSRSRQAMFRPTMISPSTRTTIDQGVRVAGCTIGEAALAGVTSNIRGGRLRISPTTKQREARLRMAASPCSFHDFHVVPVNNGSECEKGHT